MKKVLILGALAGQVDAIEALKARGVEVHVCAHVRSGPGVEAADEFHLADIVDPDQVEAVAKKSTRTWSTPSGPISRCRRS